MHVARGDDVFNELAGGVGRLPREVEVLSPSAVEMVTKKRAVGGSSPDGDEFDVMGEGVVNYLLRSRCGHGLKFVITTPVTPKTVKE